MEHWERTCYCVVCKLALGGVLTCEQSSVAFRVKAFKICERISRYHHSGFQVNNSELRRCRALSVELAVSMSKAW